MCEMNSTRTPGANVMLMTIIINLIYMEQFDTNCILTARDRKVFTSVCWGLEKVKT